MRFWKPELFRALKHRNFRLFFWGQMLSMGGTWMQRVAQGWLAYRLTGSPLLLGYLAFAGSVPALLLTPIGGVIADRVNRHRMLVVTQSLEMVQSFLLAWATLKGSITPGWLVFYAFLLGIFTAFDNPGRNAFFVQMIPDEDLGNAIALNASLVSMARLVGPAIAGLVVAFWGEGVCFLLNALSFLAVIAALLMMRLEKRKEAPPARSGPELFREAFQFVRRTVAVRSALSLFAVLNFAGTPYLTLLPMFAGTVLDAGPTGLGWLVSASGLGAIGSSFLLASRSSTRGLPVAALGASGVLAAGLVVLGLSRNFPLSLGMLFFVGGGYVFTLAATQTLLQTWVSEAMRGRVLSFYSLIFLGIPPFGSLFAGWVAEKIGAPRTVSIGGVICLAATLYFARYHRSQEEIGAGDLGAVS